MTAQVAINSIRKTRYMAYEKLILLKIFLNETSRYIYHSKLAYDCTKRIFLTVALIALNQAWSRHSKMVRIVEYFLTPVLRWRKLLVWRWL